MPMRVASTLALSVSKISRLAQSIASMAWGQSREWQCRDTFRRQAIPMAWDFAEVNPFSGAGGDFDYVSSKSQ